MGLTELLDYKLETTAGTKTLREILAPDRPTVFVSYPMDFTPVCTKQLCSYRDDWGALSSLHCRWWGINRVALAKHLEFKKRYGLPFELISDAEGKLLKVLGLKGQLWTKRGMAVVSPEGKVIERNSVLVWTYPKPEEVRRYLEPILAS